MSGYGYNGKVLHVNLSNKTYKIEVMDEDWYKDYASGVMMGAYFMLRDTAPGIDAFSEQNLLIFAVGPMNGYDAPALAQVSVVARSPLTESIARAQCEGAFGRHLKASGYDAVIFHGRSQRPVSFFIEDGKPAFVNAEWLHGKNTSETATQYSRVYGVKAEAIMSIGQAGENMVRFASIVSGDGNQASRHGVGAVMGSKNLKAFMLSGGERPAVFDPTRLKMHFKPSLSPLFQEAPYKDSAVFDFSEKAISGNIEAILKRYRGEAPCPACPHNCIKRLGSNDAPLASSSFNMWVIGNFLDDMNSDMLLLANALCNTYGFDFVAARDTVRFARRCAKKGLLHDDVDGFALSDESSLLPLLASISERRGIGDVLAQGVERAAAKIGKDAQPIADALNQQNTPPVATKIRKSRNQTPLSGSVLDALGLCKFAPEPESGDQLGELLDMIKAVTGWNATDQDFIRWNERRNRMIWFYGIRDVGIMIGGHSRRKA